MALVAVPVTAPDRIFERELWSNVTKSFNIATTITGTTLADIWTPTSGKRFVLKGFELTALVRVQFAAALPRLLIFWDNSTSDVICSAGMAFETAQLAGTWYATTRDLKEGVASGAVNRVLKLGFAGDITTGVLHVAGVVWGEEL